MSKLKRINANSIDGLLKNISLIDIREPYEFQEGNIINSKNIPMYELLENTKEYLDKEHEYYIICHAGVRSLITVEQLSTRGYNVIDVSGGIAEYNGDNFNYLNKLD